MSRSKPPQVQIILKMMRPSDHLSPEAQRRVEDASVRIARLIGRQTAREVFSSHIADKKAKNS